MIFTFVLRVVSCEYLRIEVKEKLSRQWDRRSHTTITFDEVFYLRSITQKFNTNNNNVLTIISFQKITDRP